MHFHRALSSDKMVHAKIALKKFAALQLGLKIEDQGHHFDCIGVNIKKHCNGTYEFSQSALIDSIINDVGPSCSNTLKLVPMPSSKCLYASLYSKSFYECKDFKFIYHSFNRKLS